MRRLGRLLPAALVLALAAGLAPATSAAPASTGTATRAASAAEPGPRLTVPASTLRSAVRCYDDPRTSARTPVLLVHGTGTAAAETWDLGYRQTLGALGHAVCTVDLPRFATGDVQVNVQYVVAALRQVQRTSGRAVSVVSLSKGALETLLALRLWPDLASRVDDVIGLAGVYDRGSQAIAQSCAGQPRCLPALHQVGAGSSFLAAVRRFPVPTGPSYTAIGTPADRTVTPQPAANQQTGATSISIDEVCAGRAASYGVGHAQILGDAAAHALALDALGHRGAASAARTVTTDPGVCGRQYFDGFDEQGFADLARVVAGRRHATTPAAPPLVCALRVSCRDVAARGRVLGAARARPARRQVVLILRVQAAGQVRARLGGRTVTRAVRPGSLVLRLPRPATRSTLVVQARPRGYAPYVVERRLRLSGALP